MKILCKLMKGRKSGFVLVELLVAVAILGTIASASIIVMYGPNSAVQADQSESQQVVAPPVSTPSVQPDPSSTTTLLTDIEETADTQTIQDEANETGAEMELQIIQTAMDTMMIQKEIQSVNETAATDDMANFPADGPLYPRYLRGQHSAFKYSCDSTGQVIQVK